jgi:hypothetical protein
MIERKPNTMFDPSEIEVEMIHTRNYIEVDLIFLATGEIRQKRMSIQELAKRAFQSEIDTWKGTPDAVPIVPYRRTDGN